MFAGISSACVHAVWGVQCNYCRRAYSIMSAQHVLNKIYTFILYYSIKLVCVCDCVLCVVRVCVCVCEAACKWLEHWPDNQKAPGLMPGFPNVSLSKKHYSHYSSQPSCIMRIWWSSVNWGSSPPSCNNNGYLVVTGEANSQMPLSPLAMLGLLWNHK